EEPRILESGRGLSGLENRDLRVAALEAIKALGESPADSYLVVRIIELLHHQSPAIRIAAAKTLLGEVRQSFSHQSMAPHDPSQGIPIPIRKLAERISREYEYSAVRTSRDTYLTDEDLERKDLQQREHNRKLDLLSDVEAAAERRFVGTAKRESD